MHTLKGVLVDSIDKNSLDTLQCNMLVFKLVAPCAGCKMNYDGNLHEAHEGSLIGVPRWPQITKLWPKMVGHQVFITRGGGPRMYTVTVQVSAKRIDLNRSSVNGDE